MTVNDRRQPTRPGALLPAALLGLVIGAGGYAGVDRVLTSGPASATTPQLEVHACDSAPGAMRSPCLGIRAVPLGHGRVAIVGYVGLADHQPLTGAKVDLLGEDRVTGRMGPTGQQTLSAGDGTVAFLVPSSSHRYAFRMRGNAAYPQTASRVVAVEAIEPS